MTTDPPLHPPAPAPEQDRLRRQLGRARLRLRLQMLLETGLDAVLGAVLIGAMLVGLDAFLRLGLAAREVLIVAAALGLIAALVVRSIPRARAATLDDLGLAMTLDRFRPGTGQEVADVLQLPAQLNDPRGSASPALVRMAVARASESLAAANWRAFWNRGRTAGRALALVTLALVPVGFAVAAPDAARLSFRRWLLGSDERWPQRTYLSVVGLEGDRLIAPRDEPYTVEVDANPRVRRHSNLPIWTIPGRGESLLLRHEPTNQVVPDPVRLRERTAEGAVRDAAMSVVGPARFRHDLPPSNVSSTFSLTGGDDWLGPIRVERVDRPTLTSTTLRIKDPSSPGSDWREVDARQHLTFLPDTEVELTLVGSEPVRQARVDVHPGQAPKLDRVDPKTFTARWTFKEAMTLEIQVTAESSGLTSRPTFLSFGLLRDREPRVTLRANGVGSHVTSVATIPLTVAATDDLGLAAIRVKLERTVVTDEKSPPITTKQAVPIPLAADAGAGRAVLDHQARQDIDLATGNPAPPVGAVIRLQAEAEDRCARGTQVGRSGVLVFQVVSPEELFYEILIRQRAERAKFVALFDAAEKQGKALQTQPTPDDMAAAIRGLQNTTRQMDQIASRVGDSLTEMKLNQVGSPKSHRLLQDGVIDPLRALGAAPATELRGALQSWAANLAGKSEGDKARQLHAAFETKMKAILDQMSQWESFVDVVNQVAEVIKMQQNVLKATEQARDSRNQEVFDDKP